MALGERIRKLRLAAKLSQGDVERESGILREYISKLETGDIENPTFKTLQRLSKGLGVDIDILVTDNPQILAMTILSFELRKLSPAHQQQILEFIAFLEHQEGKNMK